MEKRLAENLIRDVYVEVANTDYEDDDENIDSVRNNPLS
jgi:hypothetical protein